MKKIMLPLIVIIPLLLIAFGFFSMSKGNIEDIIICSINDESHYIPSDVCEYYLLNHRLTGEDIKYLENGAGLAFLFDIPDKSKRNIFLQHFILKGVSVDTPSRIDGYPPLHAAIINNDPELVKFLLKNGANPNQKDKNQKLTAEEFIDFLDRTIPSIDRNIIKDLLVEHKAKT